MVFSSAILLALLAAEPGLPARPTPPPAPSPGPPPGLRPQDLRKVEQTEADVGPLRTSNRVQPPDLLQPRGFREVYQIPRDSPSKYAGWFARVDGGVIAVFPRSQYDMTKEGTKPLVPPATEFFLGSVPGGAAAAAPVSTALSARVAGQDRLDTSDTTAMPSTALTNVAQSTRILDTPPAPANPTPSDPLATAAAARALAEGQRLSRVAARVSDMFTDDRARDQRVGRLLNRAMGDDAPRPVQTTPAGK
ncbi:MAG: hypothetical protein ACKVS8_11695 [Phycisphaerales bacterium]